MKILEESSDVDNKIKERKDLVTKKLTFLEFLKSYFPYFTNFYQPTDAAQNIRPRTHSIGSF